MGRTFELKVADTNEPTKLTSLDVPFSPAFSLETFPPVPPSHDFAGASFYFWFFKSVRCPQISFFFRYPL